MLALTWSQLFRFPLQPEAWTWKENWTAQGFDHLFFVNVNVWNWALIFIWLLFVLHHKLHGTGRDHLHLPLRIEIRHISNCGQWGSVLSVFARLEFDVCSPAYLCQSMTDYGAFCLRHLHHRLEEACCGWLHPYVKDWRCCIKNPAREIPNRSLRVSVCRQVA